MESKIVHTEPPIQSIDISLSPKEAKWLCIATESILNDLTRARGFITDIDDNKREALEILCAELKKYISLKEIRFA